MGDRGLVRSPDGRTWKLDRVRPKLSEAETLEIPFFWTSVVVTLLLAAFIVRYVWVDPGYSGYVVLVPLVVWLVERGFHALRPLIRAETEGPPHELLVWRPGSRLFYGRVERRIAEAIRAGRPETDVKGAPLVGSG
jgi:predicted membrane metal-binding protein